MSARPAQAAESVLRQVPKRRGAATLARIPAPGKHAKRSLEGHAQPVRKVRIARVLAVPELEVPGAARRDRRVAS